MNEYSIILDKERKLKYSNRSFMELEKRTGRSIVSIFTDAAGSSSPQEQQKKLMDIFSTSKFLTDFVYCGLLHDNLNYDEVTDMIPVKDYMNIMGLALKVLPEEFGFTDAKVDNKKKATLKVA